MSKTRFLFDLIMYINAKRSFTAQDVADEFRVSVRTAHRYLSELSEMGVPLYTEPGRTGGYRLLRGRMLPPVMFDEDEAFAVFFAFQTLKYYPSLPFDINVKSVSRKLYANLADDMKRKVERLDAVVAIWSRKRSVASPFLKEIIEAAADRQVLKIGYASRTEDTEREVGPLGVYAYDGFWYMPAVDLNTGDVRQFRTDRLLFVETLPQTFDPPVGLAGWLEQLSGQPLKAPVRLYVELTREGMRQCRSQPWLEPYIAAADPDHGYIDAVIDESEVEFTAAYFFQLGPDAKVLEPREIADRIRERAGALVRHYG
ncbi:YafY family protein [Paenibacillus macerans]|uniref:helix-turn-helix transcriptional regulator n=1 Tax=Paenibacillus macerans TaxID=44252 RepID=UPI002040EC26|nr:YafY family protein [Paenibacillus macerans]MCM3701780.1 YafY family transcriptional regulator [Paenibacillus macerans]